MCYASLVAFLMAFVLGLAVGSEIATLWAVVVYLGTAVASSKDSSRRERQHAAEAGSARSPLC